MRKHSFRPSSGAVIVNTVVAMSMLLLCRLFPLGAALDADAAGASGPVENALRKEGVLFSVAFFAPTDVSALQLENFLLFTEPTSKIVVHFNAAEYMDTENTRWMRVVKSSPRVFINPLRTPVVRASCSILRVHLLNMVYAMRDLRLPVSHVVLASQKTVFVRSGYEQIVRTMQTLPCSFKPMSVTNSDINGWYPNLEFHRQQCGSTLIKSVVNRVEEGLPYDNGSRAYVHCFHEGYFFPRAVAERTIDTLWAWAGGQTTQPHCTPPILPPATPGAVGATPLSAQLTARHHQPWVSHSILTQTQPPRGEGKGLYTVGVESEEQERKPEPAAWSGCWNLFFPLSTCRGVAEEVVLQSVAYSMLSAGEIPEPPWLKELRAEQKSSRTKPPENHRMPLTPRTSVWEGFPCARIDPQRMIAWVTSGQLKCETGNRLVFAANPRKVRVPHPPTPCIKLVQYTWDKRQAMESVWTSLAAHLRLLNSDKNRCVRYSRLSLLPCATSHVTRVHLSHASS